MLITRRHARTKNGAAYQRGVTLMLAIFVILALTFAVLGLMYFVRYGSEVASNSAAHTEAIQATDIGLEAANAQLQQHSGFPEASNMTGVSWWYTPVQTAPGPPQPPPVSFWATCAPKSCGATSIVINGVTFNVEYVVSPSGLPPAILNGASQASSTTTSYMTYLAYVNAQLSNNGLAAGENHNMNADIEATLRKVA
ncbi:hypothetical protein C4901_05080 [Acidiferrobacter sp. SPIII_3]|jgi:hypothetical protein|nr:hypothetical protein C4901_05080 [Acidiferrobacter sp. SPIII_3]